MKNIFSFLLMLAFIPLIQSCNKDKGTIEVTYNKATALYTNLDDLRSAPIHGTSRSIDNPGKIFIDNSLLLIGEELEGIHVFDNSNPSNPVNSGFINIPYAKEFYVENNILYVESHYDFMKIDISTPTAPVLLSRVENAFGDFMLNDQGQVLVGFKNEIVTEKFEVGSREMEILENSSVLYYDYANNLIPNSVVPSSFTGNSNSANGTINRIALLNNHVFVIGASKLYNFDNTGSSMNFVEEKFISSDLETIYPQNDKLYIGTRFSMIVVDATNPSAVQEQGSYWHPTSCDPVLPMGNLAYLTLRTGDFSGCAGDENALHVVDITNPSNPTAMNVIPMNSPYGMTMISNYLFVAEGTNGLKIFDATDPVNLVQVHSDNSVVAYDMMAHPTNPNILLTTGENGLSQYSIDFLNLDLSMLSSVNY